MHISISKLGVQAGVRMATCMVVICMQPTRKVYRLTKYICIRLASALQHCQWQYVNLHARLAERSWLSEIYKCVPYYIKR